jgi:hypothetical protein
MKVLVSLKNDYDDKFAEVGMNNRTLITHLKSQFYIYKHAKMFADQQGKKQVRLEYFTNEGFYGDPYKVEYKTFS